MRRKYLLSFIYILRSASMILFVALPISEYSVYAFSFVMGLVWLGTVPLTNGLVSQIFGVRYITTLFGIVFFGHQLGAFFGVWLGGYVFDVTKSYDLVWFGSIALGLLAAALHMPINDANVIRTEPLAAQA
jgi:MFS family permease